MPETVLDSSSVLGLLQMATDESLLRDIPGNDDKFLGSLQARPLPDWRRQQILEQIIINSRIYTLQNLPFDRIEGEFLDMNLLNVAKGGTKHDEEVKSISPELIEGMLRGKGYDKTYDEWLTIFNSSNAVLKEVTEYEARHPDTNLDNPIKAFTLGMVDREYQDSEEYKLSMKWNQASNMAAPLMSAFEEFVSLSNYATSNSRYLRTPIYNLSPNLFNLKPESPNDNEAVYVFRIVTEQLGTFPVCSSLRQALKLANSPDAKALRDKMDEWLRSLQNDSADLTTKIQKDIQKATKSIHKANTVAIAGTVSGYISLPVSAIGIVNPLLGAVGLALTVVAMIADNHSKTLRNSVRWVGFGSAYSNSA